MDKNESIFYDLPLSEVSAVAAVFVVTLLMVRLWQRKRYHLPPGPWGLPIVGYLPFFGPQPHVTFNQLRKKYGDVISIRMGSWPAIVIGGCDAINEALVTKKDDFAGRPAFSVTQLKDDIRGLIFYSYGPICKISRKLIRNVLYTYCNARGNPTENIIQSEAKSVIEEFLSHKNKSFCPLERLDLAAFSMIYQLSYDRHKEAGGDQDFIAYIKLLKEFASFNSTGNPINSMPWLCYFMPSKTAKFLKMQQENRKLRERKVAEHESSFDETNLRDITDGLIHAGNQLTEKEKASGFDKKLTTGQLSTIVGAASGTVSSTLRWCVALMVTFPEVQEEVFQQINRVVGQGRDITLADRAQLPLVEATIYEVLRYTGVVPFLPPHFTTCDTTLQGYDIPADTVVLVNLYSVFTDEKLWGDPKVFRPQRFLDSEGQLDRGLVEQSPVFSLGRRRCVGEFLARMELFLFFATLMQRLHFFKPPGQADHELKACFTLSTDVQPFQLCVKQRE